MKIYFIRHGQTDWNIAGRLQGSMDIELNALESVRQRSLATWLKKVTITYQKFIPAGRSVH